MSELFAPMADYLQDTANKEDNNQSSDEESMKNTNRFIYFICLALLLIKGQKVKTMLRIIHVIRSWLVSSFLAVFFHTKLCFRGGVKSLLFQCFPENHGHIKL